MAPIRRVVLDTLKPHDPPLTHYTQRIADLDSVGQVTATLVEIDREVQNITLTVEGDSLDVQAIEDRVTDLGASVHSVDQVVAGEVPAWAEASADSPVALTDRD